jgi:hypothetical protein
MKLLGSLKVHVSFPFLTSQPPFVPFPAFLAFLAMRFTKKSRAENGPASVVLELFRDPLLSPLFYEYAFR